MRPGEEQPATDACRCQLAGNLLGEAERAPPRTECSVRAADAVSVDILALKHQEHFDPARPAAHHFLEIAPRDEGGGEGEVEADDCLIYLAGV